MDRLAQIKQRRRGKRILAAMLGNALPLFLSLYGLKCILTLYGKLTEPSKFVMGSFHLVPVKGMAAVMAGLGYLSLALFGYLSWGPPPDEDRPRIWRFMRGVIRWGSLPALWGSGMKRIK